MTSLTTAGSLVLQELTGRSSSPHGMRGEEQTLTGPTRAGLAALRRVNDRTRGALAGKQRTTGPDNQEG